MKKRPHLGSFLVLSAFILLIFSINASARESEQYVPGQVIVKLKDNNINLKELSNEAEKSHDGLESLKTKYKLASMKKLSVVSDNPPAPRIQNSRAQANIESFRNWGLDRIYLLSMKDDADMHTVIRELSNNPAVEYAEPNYIVRINAVPNDPNFGLLYGLHNTGQTGGTVDADIDAPEAWDIQTGSNNVVVAVIDTGVDYSHSDLSANMWANAGEIPNNGLDDDSNGYIDDFRGWDFVNIDNNPMDDNGHGTHVSGTIGAIGDNGFGVAGVNWRVKIMPLKFLDAGGFGSSADAVLAIQYATLMGANIMSNSWGGGGYSQTLKNAISAANDAGILFVAAAGNSNNNNDINPIYP
ncbi:MAG: S8 family peptidase [Nanoarchaeota archaeon]